MTRGQHEAHGLVPLLGHDRDPAQRRGQRGRLRASRPGWFRAGRPPSRKLSFDESGGHHEVRHLHDELVSRDGDLDVLAGPQHPHDLDTALRGTIPLTPLNPSPDPAGGQGQRCPSVATKPHLLGLQHEQHPVEGEAALVMGDGEARLGQHLAEHAGFHAKPGRRRRRHHGGKVVRGHAHQAIAHPGARMVTPAFSPTLRLRLADGAP